MQASLTLQFKGIFSQSGDLTKAILNDKRLLEQAERDSVVLNVYSTQPGGIASEERDSKNAIFMFFQVLIDILLRMTFDRNSTAKQDLIDHFKRVYDRNEAELRIVQEFENGYRPDKAVCWYTRPTFLYSTLNKALRDSDYEVLFALRFFITDLYAQLSLEHRKALGSSQYKDPILRVYRGQNLSTKEVKYMADNVGQFVSIHNFLSTSVNREIARFFVQASAPITADTTQILLQFNIDTRIKNAKPYANIAQLSYAREEEEVLLMLGSIFKIEQLEFDKLEQCWIGIFSLCSDDNYELKDLMKQTKWDVGNDITSLGLLLAKHGDYEKAESYFQQVLLEPSTEELDRASCYDSLGHIAAHRDEYDKALTNYSQALGIFVKSGRPIYSALATMAIGEIYWKKKDLDRALTYELEALPTLRDSNNTRLCDVYRTMGSIYKDKKEYKLALQYYEKALELDQQRGLPSSHDNYAITYGNIGLAYAQSGKGEKALEFFCKAKEVWLKSLPATHRNIQTIDQYIRSVKEQLKQNVKS
jgi:tetratricopeptide (TPR) repeat protein